MPSLISHYVGRHVSLGILVVASIVIGLDVFIAILGELDNASGDYTQFEAALHILLTVPRRINDYLPYSIMIGSLFGMSSLAGSSELTVIRAAGLSVFRIILMVLRPVLFFVMLGMVLAEYVAPVSEQLAASRKDVLRYGDNVYDRGGGVWSREGNQYMHFSAVEPGGVLYGVSVYDFEESLRLKSITRADKAIYQESQLWQMEGVEQHVLHAYDTDVNRFISQPWATEINPDLLNVIVLKPKRLSVTNLWQYAQFRAAQGLENGRFLLSFWQKALQPLATLALVVVAMSFVFGPMRQVTMGFRLFCGIAAGLAFKMLQNILGPASLIYGFSPAISVIVPAVLCFVFAWYMLRKV